jgi:hypothetical protein
MEIHLETFVLHVMSMSLGPKCQVYLSSIRSQILNHVNGNEDAIEYSKRHNLQLNNSISCETTSIETLCPLLHPTTVYVASYPTTPFLEHPCDKKG